MNTLKNLDIRFELTMQFVEQVLQNGSDSITQIKSMLTFIFLIGGFGIALLYAIEVWVVIVLCRRKFLLINTGFLLIPFEKLDEETTIHLLKNLMDI